MLLLSLLLYKSRVLQKQAFIKTHAEEIYSIGILIHIFIPATLSDRVLFFLSVRSWSPLSNLNINLMDFIQILRTHVYQGEGFGIVNGQISLIFD